MPDYSWRGPFRAQRRLRPKPIEQQPPDPGVTVRPSPMENSPDHYSDVFGGLHPGTASLRVYQRGPSNFGIEARSCCTEVQLFADPGWGRPDLAINDNIAEKGPPPGAFINKMRVWSSQKGPLTNWLYLRRCEHPDLKLVVWDETPYRIPWEMLWVPNKPGTIGPEPGFLGARLPVSRQFKLNGPFPEIMRTSEIPAPYQDDGRANGPVAAYIAAEMALDKSLLTDFTLDPPIRSMEDLFINLASDQEPVAMVYVACHGTFGSDPRRCTLGGFPYGRTADFDDDLARLRGERRPTLVFLNSCVSGLIGVDVGKYNDGALRGFAEVFLRAGAAGVLATTGAVGKAEARVLAGKLLTWLKANPGLSVAEGIRQLREESLTEMEKPENRWWKRSDLPPDRRDEADRQLLPLLYPFMYIYFGGPWMAPAAAQLSDVGGFAETGEQP